MRSTRERLAEPEHVRVRIGDAGDDRAAAEVDDLVFAAPQRHGPAQRSPTKTIFPPRTAIASAIGRASSTV